MNALPTATEDLAAPRTMQAGALATVKRRSPRRVVHRRRLSLTVIAAMALLGLALVFGYRKPRGPENSRGVLYTVRPIDLPLSVTERGTLESQRNAEIICEVEDIPEDGIDGVPILWIIENGSQVEKGDLIVELDAASLAERLDEQMLDTIYARGQFEARSLDVEIRETSNETEKANAEQDVKTATLQFDQYEDEQGGTFQIELQKHDLTIEQAKARKSIDDRNLKGMQSLYELHYKSYGDLAQARLQALRSKTALDRAENQRRMLVEFTYARSRLELEGALESAKRAKVQTERNNEATLAQNKVWLAMATLGKSWNEQRLARYQQQLTKCKIYAPQRGMVAYHAEASRWGNSSFIREGATVRYRQPLLSIPDLSTMQIRTAVHESVIDRVRAGQSASIHVDAFPDRQYPGTVTSVDVLPDASGWLSSDTKVYKTIVAIDRSVEGIQPGMTAVVEIQLGTLPDALSVPIQAIVQRGNRTWCYVTADDTVTKRYIEPGQSNRKFVEVRSGLSPGDQVILNPATVLDTDQDLEHRIGPDGASNTDYSFD